MPALRKRQPRRFPAYRPDDPVVRLVWREAAADGETVAALNALAADTPYVGHSSSLTRCRFHTGEAPIETAQPRRRIYPRRLAELEAAFKSGRRPSPGATVRPAASGEAEPARSVFADRWLVLEHVDGDMPDLRAAALVSRELHRVRPILILAQPQAQAAVCAAAAEGAALLARDYTFPESDEDDAPRSDLDYPKGTAGTLLRRAANGEERRYADLLSALMSDAAGKDDKIEATPLRLLFGQGHRHFLDRLATVPRTEAPPPRGRGRSQVKLTAAETRQEALFAAWTRPDPTPAFRWDPAEDVRYALRADDPSGEKSTTQHGANRLAALGLPVLAGAPVQRGDRVRLQMAGGTIERNELALHWPIRQEPTSLAAIRTLLTHPDLPRGPVAVGHLGVVEVRGARRIGVGRHSLSLDHAPGVGCSLRIWC